MSEHGLHGWLLFVHLLAAMVWLGGAVVLAASAAWALRRSDAVAVARFTRSLRTLGPLLLAPAPALLLGSGLWLVAEHDDADWTDGWVLAGLGLFTIAFGGRRRLQ